MATDFAVLPHRFLTSHLAGLRGCSPNTIASYRDTFKLLIAWYGDVRSIPPGKLTLDCIDAHAVTGFPNWLEAERGNSIATRTQRLAAVSSSYRWLQSQDPARMAGCQEILAIPAKKQAQPGVNHLTAGQTRLLLAQPDRSTRRGRRDATLLEHPGFGGDSILPRCSGLGGRCLPRYRRLAEPRSDHFPAFVLSNICPAALSSCPAWWRALPARPPGGGLGASPRRAPAVRRGFPGRGQG